jgi:hypothetical protein
MVMALVVTVASMSSAAGADAQTVGEFRVAVTATWDLGLRVGVDWRPWEHVGFAADVGSTLFSLEGAFILSGDAYVVIHGLPPEDRLEASLRLGVPDWRVVFAGPAQAMVALGVSAQIGYAIVGPWNVFARAGAGVPWFVSSDGIALDRTSFPLGLWPDLSLGVTYRVTGGR